MTTSSFAYRAQIHAAQLHERAAERMEAQSRDKRLNAQAQAAMKAQALAERVAARNCRDAAEDIAENGYQSPGRVRLAA